MNVLNWRIVSTSLCPVQESNCLAGARRPEIPLVYSESYRPRIVSACIEPPQRSGRTQMIFEGEQVRTITALTYIS